MYAKGQKLVCTAKHDWHDKLGRVTTFPKSGDVVTFNGAEYMGYIGLIECEHILPNWFPIKYFVPLQGREATSELTSSFVEVSEKSDLISVPEKEMA